MAKVSLQLRPGRGGRERARCVLGCILSDTTHVASRTSTIVALVFAKDFSVPTFRWRVTSASFASRTKLD